MIPLNSRAKEWTLKLDDMEEIVAIAASEQLVVIALANYIIRVCSSYGTQRAIFSVPGPVVCLAAFREDILVAYHGGSIRNGDQCICFKLFRLEGEASAKYYMSNFAFTFCLHHRDIFA